MTLQHLDAVIAFAVVMLGASLLITIFTQTVSTLFGFRGINLMFGLQVLFKTIKPDISEGHAKCLAEEILTHPILSDSVLWRLKGVPILGPLTRRWRLASAVRVEELVRVLPSVAQSIQHSVAAAQKPGDPPAATNAPVQTSGGQAATAMVKASDPATALTIRRLLGVLHTLGPGETEQAQQVIAELTAAAQTSAMNLTTAVETWFNSAMDRVSQRFVLQMRVWTVVFSILLAFGAHLDALRLLNQLSGDAELRSQLVSSAETMNKQGADILASQADASSNVPGIYQAQMIQLESDQPDTTKGLGKPPMFESRDAAVQWLRDAMQGSSATEALVTQYQQGVDKGLKGNADKLLDQAIQMKTTLANTGYQLVPNPYPQPWYKPWETYSQREFWGTMAAAALLSLGAPFWFNALKTLTNLRPILATKEEDERNQKSTQDANS